MKISKTLLAVAIAGFTFASNGHAQTVEVAVETAQEVAVVSQPAANEKSSIPVGTKLNQNDVITLKQGDEVRVTYYKTASLPRRTCRYWLPDPKTESGEVVISSDNTCQQFIAGVGVGISGGTAAAAAIAGVALLANRNNDGEDPISQ
ncbi:MAG: hypothetical protein R3F02_01825 [Thiolinea sp.]